MNQKLFDYLSEASEVRAALERRLAEINVTASVMPTSSQSSTVTPTPPPKSTAFTPTPTASSQTGVTGLEWIPITERLPGIEIEECEVTYNFVNKGLNVFEPSRRRVARATYKGGELDVDTPYGSFKVSHAGGAISIFAWRPLPKPYNPIP